MTKHDVIAQLQTIVSQKFFDEHADSFVGNWKASGVGIGAVEPVLRFIESHPDWDLGSPGPFVHFVEQFYGAGYEQLLLDSIRRRPTVHSAWMLNRIINGEKDAVKKQEFMTAMQLATQHALADRATINELNHFLQLHIGS